MADLNISNELKISKEELLLGKITIQKVGCGAFREAHGLLANDLSVELGNGTIIPLLDYIGDNNQVLENTLRLVGTTGFTIEENRPIGTLVGNLGATGGTSPYTFSVQDARFRIQSNRLETNHVFDFETETSPIQLDLKVTDSTGVYNFRPYTVTLLNVNDSMSVTLAPSYTVDEHSANGTTVGTINVSGGVSPYTMSLADTSKFYLSNAGVITVNGDIEYDDGSPIVVLATIQDHTGSSVDTSISINIIEVVQTPELSIGAIAPVTIDEHTQVGTSLTVATASGGVTPYTYSITGSAFDINANTGDITVALDLEYDAGATITATVAVTDNAGGSASTTLTVNLTEVLDLTVSAPATITVTEHTTVGTQVATAAVSNGVAPYTYSIAEPHFDISNTGVITVAADIEYDTDPTINLTIIVSDNVGDTANTSMTVTVEEATPLVASNGMFNINENEPAYTTVGQLSITGGTTPYTVSIDGGSSDFAISNTGTIVAQRSFDFETQDSYALDITVSDNAGQTDTCHIVIDINDVAETVTTLGATRGEVVSVSKDIYNANEWFYATHEDMGGGDFKIGVKKIKLVGGSFVPVDTFNLERTISADTINAKVYRLQDIACITHQVPGTNGAIYVQTFNADTNAPSDSFIAAPAGAEGFSIATDVGDPSTIYISYVESNTVHIVIKSVARDGSVTNVLADTFTAISNFYPKATSIIAASSGGKKAIIGISGYSDATGSNVWNGSLYSINDDNTKSMHTSHDWHHEPAYSGGFHILLRSIGTKFFLIGTTSEPNKMYQAISFDSSFAFDSLVEHDGDNRGRNITRVGTSDFVSIHKYNANQMMVVKNIEDFPPVVGDIVYPANHKSTALTVPNTLITDGAEAALLYINDQAELELVQVTLPA